MSPFVDSPLLDSPVKPLKKKDEVSVKSPSYFAQLDAVLNDVDCIEIGTTNVCNRKCVSCPVGTGAIADKLTADSVSYGSFSKILDNLSVFKQKTFSLSLHEYNEPLKDTNILNKYLMAGRAFPQAELTLFTNGDMLHHSKQGFYTIQDLLTVGIRHIRISIYDSSPDRSKIFQRIGIDKDRFEQQQNRVKNRMEYAHHLRYQNQAVLIRVLFLSTKKLSNRGGIIATDKAIERVGICSLPRRTLSIDYRGNLKMCCNVHHMETGSESMMYGSLVDTPVSELLMSKGYSHMREKTTQGDYRDFVKCQVCDFYQKSSDRLLGASHTASPF